MRTSRSVTSASRRANRSRDENGDDPSGPVPQRSTRGRTAATSGGRRQAVERSARTQLHHARVALRL
jgi:hypothetical protein